MEKELDKIYEVYMNEEGSQFTAKTRERIQWICSQAEGDKMLDVGCSQGITSILLGRENKKVLALDIEEEAISFANDKLKEEEAYVQENVKFEVGDFTSYDFGGQKYDTIIMTEVLEHIVDVQAFIDKIADCAEQWAKIIITVPFGINDHWDHKRTYYFGMLYEQLAGYKIIDVQFMGKWLGVVAKFDNDLDEVKGINPDKALMLEEEKSFFSIERNLVDKNVQYKEYIAGQKDKIGNLVQKNENLKLREKALKEKSVKLQEENIALRDENTILQDKSATLQEMNVTLKEKSARLQERNTVLKERDTRLQERNIKLQERNTKLQERNAILQKKYTNINEKYQRLSKSLLGRITLFIWRVVSVAARMLYAVYAKVKELFSAKEAEKDLEEQMPDQPVVKSLQVNVEETEGKKPEEKELEKKEPEKKEPEKVPEKETEICKSVISRAVVSKPKVAEKKKIILPEFMNETVIMNDVFEFDWKENYLALRDDVCDVKFLQRMDDKIQQIPESNGSRYYGTMPYKIGMIADEFLYRSYADVANFFYITPDDYQYDIDVLFVATAWKGLHNEWKGLGNVNNAEMRNKLFHIIDYYKKLGKKVVFYSKEDPSNYYVFLEIAKKCDYIFTTAEECVEHYKEDTGISKVAVLDFSINPIQFNPIGIQMFNYGEVLFAGTWWNKKYPERKEDMETIFQNVLKAGKDLKLIDRNYSMGNPDYFYPEKYLKYVSPEVSHAILQKIHKMYSWAINVNSIKNSNTMFAGRVYELQALGNLIISNHSKGMEHKFPAVIVEDGSGKSVEALTKYSEEEIYEKRIDGVRRVMTGETTYDRVNFMMDFIGEEAVNYEKKIGIVIPEENEAALSAMAQEQSYKNKEIIKRKDLNQETFERYEMIAFFDSDSEYSQFYIEDMVNAFKYTDCDFATKKAYFEGDRLIGGVEHDFVSEYDEIGRTVFWRSSYALDELLCGNAKKNRKGYSVDHFNYKKGN